MCSYHHIAYCRANLTHLLHSCYQTPEWKRAYIDYRRLKKQIKAVRESQEDPEVPKDARDADASGKDSKSDADDDDDEDAGDSSDKEDHGPSAELRAPGQRKWSRFQRPWALNSPDALRLKAPPSTSQSYDLESGNDADRIHDRRRVISSPATTPQSLGIGASRESTSRLTRVPSPLHLPDRAKVVAKDWEKNSPASATSEAHPATVHTVLNLESPDAHQALSSPDRPHEPSSARLSTRDAPSVSIHRTSDGERPLISQPKAKEPTGRSPRFFGSPSLGIARTATSKLGQAASLERNSWQSIHGRRFGSSAEARFPENLEELYELCTPEELKFFNILDGELQKVEAFYEARLSDGVKKSRELRRQLNELAEHRRVYHEAEEGRNDGGKLTKMLTKQLGIVSTAINASDSKNQLAHAPNGRLSRRSVAQSSKDGQEVSLMNGQGEEFPTTTGQPQFNPEKYRRYKKKLRNAIVEFYKELEILKNYRILNITGFKKALKKFEKTARIKCIDLYFDNKIAKTPLADGTTIDKILKDMEDEFTVRFEKGNHKKAIGRLRGQFVTKTVGHLILTLESTDELAVLIVIDSIIGAPLSLEAISVSGYPS